MVMELITAGKPTRNARVEKFRGSFTDKRLNAVLWSTDFC